MILIATDVLNMRGPAANRVLWYKDCLMSAFWSDLNKTPKERLSFFLSFINCYNLTDSRAPPALLMSVLTSVPLRCRSRRLPSRRSHQHTVWLHGRPAGRGRRQLHCQSAADQDDLDGRKQYQGSRWRRESGWALLVR